MQSSRHQANQGFTLIELSIVLVIIGLIVGGVLGGQELIRSSELNSVVTDANKYKTALNTFRLKYTALPGDQSDATSYWGSATCPNGARTGTQTCNGNGDGFITGDESYLAWQHLGLSGILPGNFTGSHTTNASVIGTNTPAAKLNGAGWGIQSGVPFFTASAPNVNRLYFGAQGAAIAGGSAAQETILKPDEAASIDKKMDDGLPNTGKLFGGTNGGGTTSATTCATVNTSAAVYNLALTTSVCGLAMDAQ